MAYINAKDVKAIRETLKAEFKDFKFSVKKDHSSSVRVTVLQGPKDFSDITDSSGYAQINQYWLDRTGQHQPIFEKMIDIIKTAPITGEGYRKGTGWYDNSDAMTDYFDTSYYISLNVGSRDKPYVQAS